MCEKDEQLCTRSYVWKRWTIVTKRGVVARWKICLIQSELKKDEFGEALLSML
jgi:hypothetical protein